MASDTTSPFSEAIRSLQQAGVKDPLAPRTTIPASEVEVLSTASPDTVPADQVEIVSGPEDDGSSPKNRAVSASNVEVLSGSPLDRDETALILDRTFDPDAYYQQHGDAVAGPDLDKLARVKAARMNQRGDPVQGAKDFGGAAAKAFAQVLKSIPAVAGSVLKTGRALQPDAAIQDPTGAAKAATETVASVEAALAQNAEIARSAGEALTDIKRRYPLIGLLSDPLTTAANFLAGADRTITPDEARDRLISNRAAAEMVRDVTAGEGSWASRMTDEFKALGLDVVVDPKNVDNLTWVTDPMNILPSGAGFKAVTTGGRTVLRGASQAAVRQGVGRMRELAGAALERAGAGIERAATTPRGAILGAAADLVVGGGGATGALGGAAGAAGARVAGRGIAAAGRMVGGKAPVPGTIRTAGEIAGGAARGAVAPLNPLGAPESLFYTGAAGLELAAGNPEDAGSLLGNASAFGTLGGAVAASKNAAGRAVHRKVLESFRPTNEIITNQPTQAFGDNPAWDAEHHVRTEALRDTVPDAVNRFNWFRGVLRGFGYTPYIMGRDAYANAVAEANGTTAADALQRGVDYGNTRGFINRATGDIFLNGDLVAAGHEIGHALAWLMPDETRRQFHDALAGSYGPDQLATFGQWYDSLLGAAGSRRSNTADILEEMGAEMLSTLISSERTQGMPPGAAQIGLEWLAGLGEEVGLYRPTLGGEGASVLGVQPSASAAIPARRFLRDVFQGLGAARARQTGAVAPPTLPGAPTPGPVPPPLVPGAAPSPAQAPGVPPSPPAQPVQPAQAPSAPAPGGPPAPPPVSPPSQPAPTPPAPPSAPGGGIYGPGPGGVFGRPRPTIPQLAEAEAGVTADPTRYDRGVFDTLVGVMSAPQGQVVPVQMVYRSVKTAGQPPTPGQRFREREEAYVAEALAAGGVPPDVRAAVEKLTVPYRFEVRTDPKTGKPNVNVNAMSPDKVVANAYRLARMLAKRGPAAAAVFPYPIGRDGNLTPDGWRSLVRDTVVYTQNHANGYAGDGSQIVAPAGYTQDLVPVNPAYTPQRLPLDSAYAINVLMGIAPPQTSKAPKGMAGAPVTAYPNVQAGKLAEANRRFVVRPAPTSIAGQDVYTKGGANIGIAETNPIRAKLAGLGVDLSGKEGLHRVTEELSLEEIEKVVPAPSNQFRAPSTPAMTASFMPAAGGEAVTQPFEEAAARIEDVAFMPTPFGPYSGEPGYKYKPPSGRRIRDSWSPATERGQALEDQGYQLLFVEDDIGPWKPTMDEGRSGDIALLNARGEPLGAVQFTRTGPTVLHVDNSWLAPAYRGQGIGETLYRELGAFAQGEGVTNISGDVVGIGAAATRRKVFGNRANAVSFKGEKFSTMDEVIAAMKAKAAPEGAVAGKPTYSNETVRVVSPVDPGLAFMPAPDPAVRHVRSAAVRFGDSPIYTGPVHFLAIADAEAAGIEPGSALYDSMEMGFVDSEGEWLTREEALDLAKQAKQVQAKTYEEAVSAYHGPDAPWNRSLESESFLASKRFMPRKADERTSGVAFKKFFSDVTKGADKYRPGAPWRSIIPLGEQEGFLREYDKHTGNFDAHIATSIPGFKDVQVRVGDALVQTLPAGSKVLDVGASEGSWLKTVVKESDGRVKGVALDPNPDMADFFRKKSDVFGAEYVEEAFLAGFEDGGREYKAHDPGDGTYDAIHESMVFQFISPDRAGQIAEAKRLLKPDGLFITEEKVLAKSPEVWRANEAKKDRDWKNKFYTDEALAAKQAVVKFTQDPGETKAVGMVDNMVTGDALEAELRKNFKHVTQYWDSGNFRGYVASDNEARLNDFVEAVGDTNTEYSTRETPVSGRFAPEPSKGVDKPEEAGKAAYMSRADRMEEVLKKVRDGDEFGASFEMDGRTYEPSGPVDIVTLDNVNVPLAELTGKRIEAFLMERPILMKRGLNLVAGAFKLDSKPGYASIDLNTAVPKQFRDNTLAFARWNGQESIFDLEKFEVVPAGGDSTPQNLSEDELIRASHNLSKGYAFNDRTRAAMSSPGVGKSRSRAFGGYARRGSSGSRFMPDPAKRVPGAYQTGAERNRIPSLADRVSFEDVLAALPEHPELKGFVDATLDMIEEQPGFARPKGLRKNKYKERYEAARNKLADNLEFMWKETPEAKRELWRRWYEFANEFAESNAAKYGLPMEAVAGMNASLSPQKDWFENVTATQLLLETMRKDPEWTAQHADFTRAVLANRSDGTGRVLALAKLDKIKPGTKLSELDSEEASWLARADNELFSDQRVRDHTGALAERAAARKVRWNSYRDVEKAISIYRDPSLSNISAQVGNAHKVRNFYNNHVDPSNADDVTIDTHATAAALLQVLGGTDEVVMANFGTSPGAPQSTAAGYSGLYSLFADAYRTAADRVGALAREMQSVVWEAIREQVPANIKRGNTKETVLAIHDAVAAGELTPEAGRRLVWDYLGARAAKRPIPSEAWKYLPKDDPNQKELAL